MVSSAELEGLPIELQFGYGNKVWFSIKTLEGKRIAEVGDWIIKGAFISDADFGQFDWTSVDGIVEIPLTIAMDYCILNY
jgi:hypothetical protein